MDQDQYTVGNLFATTACISKEMMLQYVDGQLSKSATRMVEAHLVDCAFCDAALEGMQAVGTKKFEAMLQSVSQRIEAQQASTPTNEEKDNVIEFRPQVMPPVAQKSSRRLIPMMSIAASIILLAVISILYINGDTAMSIADDNFEKIALGTRSATSPSETLMQQATIQYNNGNLQEAAALFVQVGNPDATFDAGNCYYQLGQYDRAAAQFQTGANLESTLQEKSEYYLALTYLKMERVADAKTILEGIVANAEHGYVKKAATTLDAVNDL